MNNGISVIICSYNSEYRIKKVLRCLLDQKNADDFAWEVIMVDNASTDNTIETARKSWHHPKVPLHIFYEPKQGQSYATRTGIKKAKYDIIIMVDDDNYMSPNYVSRAYTIMVTHPEVGIAGGRGIGEFDNEPPAWLGSIEQALAIGPQGEHEGYVDDKRGYIYGAGSIFRKSVYDYLLSNNFQLMLKGRIGKSLVAGEDTERCLAFRILGYKLWYDPSLEFKHHMSVSRFKWNYIRKLFQSFGRTAVYFDLYKQLIKNPRGIHAFVSQYTVLDILHKLIKLLRVLPSFIKVLMTGSGEGKKEVLDFDYFHGYLSERIIHMTKIKRYGKRLKHAAWRRKKNTAIITR